MEREKIERIIEQLENIKSRPASFIGNAGDEEALIHFFHGYSAAIFIIEGERMPILDVYHKIHKRKGWQINALGIAPQMKEKGFSGVEIVQELITIEIEAWKTLL
jgi:hypothetical protein